VTDAEVEGFEAFVRRRDRRAGWLALLVLVLAIVVPIVLYLTRTDWDGEVWRNVVFFDCALLGHELCHRLAMRGHRPRPRLFLATLFGARHPAHLAAGSRTKLFRLHLMGALPGLLLGAVVLALAEVLYWLPELEWFAVGSVVLGFLSLLPVPLADGGRIVDLVLLPRSPRLSAGLQLGAAIVIILGSVLLMMIATLVAIPLVVSAVRAHRLARVRAWWWSRSPTPQALDAAGALHAVSEAGYARLAFPRRCRLAAALLTDPVAPPLSPALAVFLAVVYLATLTAAAAILIGMSARL
jgi:hypothetical protein